MLRLTTKGRNSVRALFDIAENNGNRPVPTRDIAARQKITKNYAEQILTRLRRAGLVKSIRGPAGGYLLGKSPSRITVGDIIRVAEGPVSIAYCATDAAKTRSCRLSAGCATQMVWKKLLSTINNTLDSITLADLKKQKI